MERPPTIREVEDALQELKIPQRDRLYALQFKQDELLERIAESERFQPALLKRSAQLRRLIRAQQQLVYTFPDRVYRTLLVQGRNAETLEAVAVVPQDTAFIRPVSIRGWSVVIVPCSWRLLRCRPGNVVPSGLVVSVDGSPVLPAEERAKALKAELERRIDEQERRLGERERRKLGRERLFHERAERQRQDAERREAIRLQEEIRRQEERQRRKYEEWQQEQRAREEAEAYARRLREREEALLPAAVAQERDPESPEGTQGLLRNTACSASRRRSLRTLLHAQAAGFCIGCLAGIPLAGQFFTLVGLFGALIGALVWSAIRDQRD
jgi:hypothetical protein